MEASNFTFFLLNLQKLLIFTRSNLSKLNLEVLMSVLLLNIEVLLREEAIDLKLFQNEIINCLPEGSIEKDVVQNLFVYNYQGTRTNFKEVENYVVFIYEVLNQVCFAIRDSNFERSYLLIDAVHCLPQMLIEFKKWDRKSFWYSFIKISPPLFDEEFLGKWEIYFIPKGTKWGKLKKLLNL
ncbi:hypothetical protein [Paenibacillus whitsoniae]|uniref:Uncharacterized protein n=1 Tax=Paenibacillus whitsoniae TaxID=2496558 RepID=A0A430JKF7_9BACL|nr:hypothetical protein [Paenibacillus whitsoniae]RTE11541.1 hypothetical protein EJQ19_01730 [Paenibacillus whitsoniae]